MKRKQTNKMIHLTMNTGRTHSVEPIEPIKDPKFHKRWTLRVVEAGGGGIPLLPNWKVVIVTHNGFAVFQVYYGNGAVVTSNYVAWTKKGANEAWICVRDAYKNQSPSMIDVIPDFILKRDKPLSSSWIATIIEPGAWNAIVAENFAKELALIDSIEQCIALAIVEYNSSTHSTIEKSPARAGVSYPLMTIRNDGESIVSSNYFGSDLENAGLYLVSCNKGTIRLMWPRRRMNSVQEMKSAKEIIATAGVYQGAKGLEILFDDHSKAPFAIQMTDSSVHGLMPGDPGNGQWKFAVWVWGDGRPKLVFSCMAHWRRGGDLPDLRPLDGHNHA